MIANGDKSGTFQSAAFSASARGFTMIELLVVISIIGVLTAILIPALGRAREQAKFIRCKANLKSYGILAFMYIDDNDGIMPSSWTSFYNRHGEYRGEPHHLKKYPNKLDYSIKFKEFLDHYLKGKPAPDWMTRGVPYTE